MRAGRSTEESLEGNEKEFGSDRYVVEDEGCGCPYAEVAA